MNFKYAETINADYLWHKDICIDNCFDIIIKSKRKIGWCASCFDLLHAGHCLYLNEASKKCEFLMVGLQTDPTIDRPEKNKPIQSLEERLIQLISIKCVDLVVIYENEESHRNLIAKIKPTYIFKGADYQGKTPIEHTGIAANIGELVYLPRNHGWSTSELKQRINPT